jgi:hypothetical protein
MNYSLERAIIQHVRRQAQAELGKNVPIVPHYDHRLIGFCIVQTLIETYKETGEKRSLELILEECGIGKRAYYNWYEKYYASYARDIKI